MTVSKIGPNIPPTFDDLFPPLHNMTTFAMRLKAAPYLERFPLVPPMQHQHPAMNLNRYQDPAIVKLITIIMEAFHKRAKELAIGKDMLARIDARDIYSEFELAKANNTVLHPTVRLQELVFASILKRQSKQEALNRELRAITRDAGKDRFQDRIAIHDQRLANDQMIINRIGDHLFSKQVSDAVLRAQAHMASKTRNADIKVVKIAGTEEAQRVTDEMRAQQVLALTPQHFQLGAHALAVNAAQGYNTAASSGREPRSSSGVTPVAKVNFSKL